jgi:hypothetical protein
MVPQLVHRRVWVSQRVVRDRVLPQRVVEQGCSVVGQHGGLVPVARRRGLGRGG